MHIEATSSHEASLVNKSQNKDSSFDSIELPPARYDDSPPVRMGTIAEGELMDIEDVAPASGSDYNEYSFHEESPNTKNMSMTYSAEEPQEIPVYLPPSNQTEIEKQQETLAKAQELYKKLKLDLSDVSKQQSQKSEVQNQSYQKSLNKSNQNIPKPNKNTGNLNKSIGKSGKSIDKSSKNIGNARSNTKNIGKTGTTNKNPSKIDKNSSDKKINKQEIKPKSKPKTDNKPSQDKGKPHQNAFFEVEAPVQADQAGNPLDFEMVDSQPISQEPSIKQVRSPPKKKDEQAEKLKQIEKGLLQRQREMNKPPPPQEKAAVKPKPPVAPQPRSLGSNLYKLHQLAENIPSSGDSKLTANSLSGTLIQAIKTMSVKISEEFTLREIQDEVVAAKKALNILKSTNACTRADRNYHDDSKKLVTEYLQELENHSELLRAKQAAETDIESVTKKIRETEPTKAVVKTGDGKYVRAGMLPELGIFDNIDKLQEVSADILKEHPLDVIVQKFERAGLNLEQIFQQLDADGDKVLTLKEIKEGLPSLQVDLTAEDHQLILTSLDSNSDGVVTIEEFTTILNPKLAIQKEYRTLVGDLNINNPIVFEEEILDMKIRGKFYKEDMQVLIKKLGPAIPVQRKIVQRIAYLEKCLESMRPSQTQKEDVESLKQNLQEVSRKQQNSLERQTKLEEDHKGKLDQLKSELKDKSEQKKELNVNLYKQMVLVGAAEQKQKAMKGYEDKLEKANKIIATVMIQSRVRAFIQRRRYKKKQNK